MPATSSPALKAIRPGDDAYRSARHTFGKKGAPDLIVRAATAADVQRTVALAAERGSALAVRSGGHGASTNDGGIVVDLGDLRDVQRIGGAESRLVRIGPGSRWGEVARALDPHDLAISSGDFGDVGVGGLATGGGIGLFARRQGLTIDRVRAAEVVLADGSLVRADERQHSDLLWGIRGAGGALGVVTALEIEAEPIGEVTAAEFSYEPSDLPGLVAEWAALVAASDRALTSFLYLQAGPGAVTAHATVIDTSDERTAGSAAAAFAGIAPVVDGSAERVRYASLLRSDRQPHHGQAAAMATRGGLVEGLSRAAAEDFTSLLTSGAAMTLQIRSIGGAVNDIDPMATAYPHRSHDLSLVAVAPRPGKPRLDAAWDAGIGLRSTGAYLNLETERDDAVLRRAFPGETLARLRDVKRRYDPYGLFASSLPLPAG